MKYDIWDIFPDHVKEAVLLENYNYPSRTTNGETPWKCRTYDGCCPLGIAVRSMERLRGLVSLQTPTGREVVRAVQKAGLVPDESEGYLIIQAMKFIGDWDAGEVPDLRKAIYG